MTRPEGKTSAWWRLVFLINETEKAFGSCPTYICSFSSLTHSLQSLEKTIHTWTPQYTEMEPALSNPFLIHLVSGEYLWDVHLSTSSNVLEYYTHKFVFTFTDCDLGELKVEMEDQKERAQDKTHQPHCSQTSKKSSLRGLPIILCSLDPTLIYSAAFTLMSVCNKGCALQRWDTAGWLIML